MNELSEFLLARIAEDEAAALAMGEDSEVPVYDNPELDEPAQRPWTDFASRFNVARVLAECEAKRRVVELHKEFFVERLDDEFPGESCDALCDVDNDDFPCATLRLLALPYVSHPDYDEGWRP